MRSTDASSVLNTYLQPAAQDTRWVPCDGEPQVAEFVRKVKAKEDGVRLMGFGHRVYKNYDPRAKYFRGLVIDVLQALNIKDDSLEVAMVRKRLCRRTHRVCRCQQHCSRLPGTHGARTRALPSPVQREELDPSLSPLVV